jgi:uncharacterized protein
MPGETVMAALAAALLIVGGWCVFSLCAGIVTYRSSMTRKGAVSGLRKYPDVNAHGKDPLVMDRINEAKARWERFLAEGSVERLFVTTRDGLRLCGYFVAAEKKPQTGKISREVTDSRAVILVHGLRDSAAGMAYLAEEYHASGWNVLSVDLRSHGASDGSIITMGVREGRDLSLWVDELVKRFDFASVYMHGVSMGANAVLFYGFAARGVSSRVRGLIVDSFFPSYRDTLIRLLARVVGNRFVARSVTAGASVVSTLRSGVRFGRMDVKRAMTRRRSSSRQMPVRAFSAPVPSARALPLLAFHGGTDAIIPLQSILSLFGSGVIPDAEVVVIPEAPHIGAYFYDRDRYLSKINTFTRRFS